MAVTVALQMPVLVARESSDIQGAVMGYTTLHPAWPTNIAEEWEHFEKATSGLNERLLVYEEIVEKFKPSVPHYYLGVIGVDPAAQGRGIGAHLLRSFCDRSAGDPASCGFVEAGRGTLGTNTLWCMYLPHRSADVSR
jgi:ribosomal protein S18 acetylase RimI-like enzyme